MANNIFTGKNIFFANATEAFSEIEEINETNVSLIIEIDDVMKSYKPGRSINAITGFTEGKGYIIEALQDFDISAYDSLSQTNTDPAAPTLVGQNNYTKEFCFKPPAGYLATDCSYTINGGAVTKCDSCVIAVGETAVAIGDLHVYVHAAVGRNEGTHLTNVTAFTLLTRLTHADNIAENAGSTAVYYAGTIFDCINKNAKSKIEVTGTIHKVRFKLAALPPSGILMWFAIWRFDGSTYNRVGSRVNFHDADFVVGVNEFVPAAGLAVEAGDFIGVGFISNTGGAAFIPSIEDGSGTDLIRTAATIPAPSAYNWDAGGAFLFELTTGFINLECFE